MAKKKMSKLDIISMILLIVGGLNWGLFAFGLNLVSYLPSIIAKIVYFLVGASAVYAIAKFPWKK